MFNYKEIYDFNTKAPIILGSTYTNMKVVIPSMPYEEALKKRDIITLHENLTTVLDGLPANMEEYVFVLFENSTGEQVLLAEQWIDPDSVALKNLTKMTITVNNIALTDVSVIQNAITELGYIDLEITTD